MALTPQEVSEKKFTSTKYKKGYDEAEVDAFLDEVEAELTRLLDEQGRLRGELERAQSSATVAPAAPADPATAPISAGASEMEELLRRTLLLGQRTADEAVAEARAEAERLRSEATSEAELLRSESDRRISENERSAAIRHSATLAEQDAARRRLEDEITALRAFESDFRGRLTSYLELQLRDLHAAELAPASGSTGTTGSTPPAAPSGTTEIGGYGDDGDAAYPEEPPREPAPGYGGQSGVTPALPALPPLPEWMSADAGFAPAPTPPDDAR